MKNSNKRPRNIEVELNGEVVYTTKEMKKATEEVSKLQLENKGPIKIINHFTKRILFYKKGRYDKNYKIQSLDYNSLFTDTTETVSNEIKEEEVLNGR